MVEEALRLATDSGPLALQAAIAACHARARSMDETDWHAILALYDALVAIEPNPVIRLNRAVALAEARGAEAALPLVDALLAEGDLARYHLLHATRGELLARAGRKEEALGALALAAELAATAPERRFLENRISELAGSAGT
jgi:predicted RNA polymerase sigma factor